MSSKRAPLHRILSMQLRYLIEQFSNGVFRKSYSRFAKLKKFAGKSDREERGKWKQEVRGTGGREIGGAGLSS